MSPQPRSPGKPRPVAAEWDAVVIGSGVGGLTAAVAMAQAGERALVVEQHYLPGRRTQRSRSAAIGSVMGPGGALRRIQIAISKSVHKPQEPIGK